MLFTCLHVILANVRWLRKKTDELQANVNHLHEYRNASILAFTETWLNHDDDNKVLHIDGSAPPSGSTATVTSQVNNMVAVCVSLSTPGGVPLSTSEKSRPWAPGSVSLSLLPSQRVSPTLLCPCLYTPQSLPHFSNWPHQELPGQIWTIIPRLPPNSFLETLITAILENPFKALISTSHFPPGWERHSTDAMVLFQMVWLFLPGAECQQN